MLRVYIISNLLFHVLLLILLLKLIVAFVVFFFLVFVQGVTENQLLADVTSLIKEH